MSWMNLVWRHQAITWTNVDFALKRFCDIPSNVPKLQFPNLRRCWKLQFENYWQIPREQWVNSLLCLRQCVTPRTTVATSKAIYSQTFLIKFNVIIITKYFCAYRIWKTSWNGTLMWRLKHDDSPYKLYMVAPLVHRWCTCLFVSLDS